MRISYYFIKYDYIGVLIYTIECFENKIMTNNIVVYVNKILLFLKKKKKIRFIFEKKKLKSFQFI